MRTVKEEELRELMLARERVAKAEVELKRAKRQFEVMQLELVNAVKEGCRFVGAMIARIVDVYGPARPKWREIALRLAESQGLNVDMFEAQVILEARDNRKCKPTIVVELKQ